MSYTAAIRAVLQLKGQSPFRLAGLEVYETLTRIDALVTRCLQNHTHPLLEEIQTLTRRRHKWDETYQTVDSDHPRVVSTRQTAVRGRFWAG